MFPEHIGSLFIWTDFTEGTDTKRGRRSRKIQEYFPCPLLIKQRKDREGKRISEENFTF